ncbi:hypothetical protein BH20CHL6_BH20CHL6_08790 [soil metagenome]|jgi:hypothetical protein
MLDKVQRHRGPEHLSDVTDLGAFESYYQRSKGRQALPYLGVLIAGAIVGAIFGFFLMFLVLLLTPLGRSSGSGFEALLFGFLAGGAVIAATAGVLWQRHIGRGVPDGIGLYEQGMALVRGGDISKVRWSEVDSIRQRRTRTDMAVGPGTVKGREMSHYWVKTQAGVEWQVDSSFPEVDPIGNAMYEATQQAVVNRALESLARDGAADFGAITLQPGALTVGKKTVSLADITDTSFADGKLRIRTSGRSTVSVPVHRLANLPALVTLLNNRSRLGQSSAGTAVAANE